MPVYIDGADEIDRRGCMIKGGGAALTREKIVADLAERFVCIADESKRVAVLGAFPLPVEVIAMARGAGGAALRRAGRRGACCGPGVPTDNGQPILDVRGLHITDPLALETEVNQWPGVVTVGMFARHRASVCLLGTAAGVRDAGVLIGGTQRNPRTRFGQTQLFVRKAPARAGQEEEEGREGTGEGRPQGRRSAAGGR